MYQYKPRKVKCPICGKIFTTTSRVQKYCDPVCYAKSVQDTSRVNKWYRNKYKKKLV